MLDTIFLKIFISYLCFLAQLLLNDFIISRLVGFYREYLNKYYILKSKYWFKLIIYKLKNE